MVAGQAGEMMHIAFRADADSVIGNGHVMRCLALAEALREFGVCSHFICRASDGRLGDLIEDQGHSAYFFSNRISDTTGGFETDWVTDAEWTIQALSGLRPDWVVVDHYRLDARWHRRIREVARYVMVIDDLADRDIDADILLDQNYHEDAKSRYASRILTNCIPMFGPRYALLRPEFVGYEQVSVLRSEIVRSVLICFGGVSQVGIIDRILRAVSRIPNHRRPAQVTVIAPSQTHAAWRQTWGQFYALRLFERSNSMAELMREHDLAIGAGGGMLWERFSQGLPSVVLGIADNQRPGIESLLSSGLVFGHPDIDDLSDDDLMSLIHAAVCSTDLRAAQSRRGIALVDGHGARRVAKRMMIPQLELREARFNDSDDLLTWRNDPRVREYSHDTSIIDPSLHETWLARTLADSNRYLLIGERRLSRGDKADPVGVVRFDVRDDTATISIYLVPQQMGEGFGAPLINQACRWLYERRPEIRLIRAEIQCRNIASKIIFSRAGFKPHSQTMVYLTK
jgi:UDP-2,4-diacetamido-2,4,6-trideoxy-beta-L-altropyranose hydrolase